jgi:60 kDa SS-A/Ro ribonucleoprotein
MSNALKKYNTTQNVSVNTQLPGQVKNNAGSFTYALDDVSRLQRFLILGVDGGTYYVSEKDLTSENVSWLQDLVRRDPTLVLDTVLDVSTSGRAYRNAPAIFVLALVLNHGSDEAKAKVVEIAPKVARTATMVYDLAQYIENLGGWGRAKRKAIANWFTSKTPDQLAYQSVKYRQRNGWTLRDLMRLSHPVGLDQRVGNFILGKEPIFGGPDILAGFHEMQRSSSVNDVMFALSQYPSLPWETIPTQFLKDPEVWKTLFYNGSLNGQALVRNVVRLSKIGAFTDIKFAGDYAKKLTDEEMIVKTRLHPIQYLMASVTYEQGQLDRDTSGYSYNTHRSKNWTTNPKIADALHDGFYKAFKYSEPSGNRIRVGVDVSGSMSWSAAVGSDLTAAQGAGAMALVLANQEDYVEVLGFANTLRDLQISPRDSFSNVFRKVQMNNFGYTDPGLLIQDAMNKSIKVDTFIVITDNEINSGTQPASALRTYRQKMGIDAKLVVMAMTSTGFTIADPDDRGMLDVVGFDANVPKVVTDFMSGKI